jgi:hypothetical protein
MEDARPSTPRGTPRSSGIDADQMLRGNAGVPFRNLKEEVALRSGRNTVCNSPRSGCSTLANTPRSARTGSSLKQLTPRSPRGEPSLKQLTPRCLKEQITPRGTPRAASPFQDQTTPRSGASSPAGHRSPYQFASPRAARYQAHADASPDHSPAQSPPESPSPPPKQQQQPEQQYRALPPEQLAPVLRRISQDIPQDLPPGITIEPVQIQSAPTLITAMTLATQELLQSAVALELDNQQQQQPEDGEDQVPPLMGLGSAASLGRAESSIAGWWRSGLRRRSTLGPETLLVIPRLSISEIEGEGQAEAEASERGSAEGMGSEGQAAAALEAEAVVSAPGRAATSTLVAPVAQPQATAGPTPVVDTQMAAQVAPMVEIAAAPPSLRIHIRRASRRRLMLASLVMLLAGSACLMMFQ